MKKKDDTTKSADQILRDQIHKDSEYLENLLGPITYQEPEGASLEESLKRLRMEREALRTEVKEYEAAQTDTKSSDADSKAVRRLSEEKEAIDKKELEMDKIRPAKRSWWKRMNALTKAAVVVLVAGVCIAGISLQSEATRMWWMESFGWKIGDDSSTKVNNDENREYSEAPEWEAEAVIEQELGIKVPTFFYMPENLKFSDYRYEKITNQALIYYKMDKEYLTVSMIWSGDNYTSARNFDGAIQKEAEIETSYGKIVIRVIQASNDEKSSVIAEWDYQDVHYEIFGRIPFEEMENMIKNMVL